ncbi:MAG: DinB family protein [Bacteroidia bacterium]
MNQLSIVSIECLRQLQQWLESLDAPTYSALPLGLLGASMGKHCRHIIEFYQQLFETPPGEAVNYDKRERNLLLEQAPNEAAMALESIIQRILDGVNDQALTLEGELTKHTTPFATSLGRELLYAYEHAVHHMALMRVASHAAFPHLTFPPNFGVAYATLQHRKKTCAQ